MPPTSAKNSLTLRVEIGDHVGKGAEIGFAQTDDFGVLPGRLP